MMTIACPECGRKLLVESRLFGHLVGCPFCQVRFAAPNPLREVESSEKPCEDVGDDYWNDDSDYYYYDDDEY